MNVKEFSSGFDTLLNSYAHSAAFGIDYSQIDINLTEYEKSVFLTESQEEVVLGLYSGKNPTGESFEQTEELRRYLANLVEEAELSPITNSSKTPLGINSNSKFFTLPDGTETPTPLAPVWFIIYEAVDTEGEGCGAKTGMEVYPTTHNEYQRIKKNPFRGANDRRALRLDLADGVVEIICKYPVDKYYIRYLRRPNPIVLEALPDGLSVNGEIGEGVTDTTEPCELHEALHERILERAVRKALESRNITARTNRDA